MISDRIDLVEPLAKEIREGEPVIQVVDLQKIYREVMAVKNLSFQVNAGEVLGLIGPNGAGKTTTLRCIAGIIPPSSGRISVGGRDLRSDPTEARRLLAYVPDDPHLFESLSVKEQLRFIASVYQVEDWRSRADDLLGRFELVDKAETLGSELSRGMRQKVAAACAFLHTPSVLLLDEPMTGLDPRGIRTMHEAILDAAAGGAGVVISSHVLAMVERLCTSVLVLHHGSVLLSGKMNEIRDRFPELSGDASLEELFFRATESGSLVSPGDPGLEDSR